MGVAKVVESHSGKPAAGEVPVEQLADRFRVDRPACGVREHRVGEPDGMSVVFLAVAPGGEDCLGGRVEVDASAAGASLDRDFDGTASDALAAAGHRHPMSGLVPVTPPEPGELASSHPGHGGQLQRRVEPQVVGAVEEGSELDGGPRLGSAARPWLGAWRVGEQGDVDVDELTACGVGQGRADDDVHVVHGLRRQRCAGEPAVIEEVGVQLVEVIDTQPSQRHCPDARADVALDYPGVAVGCRRSQLRAATWHPLLGQERSDRQQARRSGEYGAHGQGGGDGFGIATGLAGGMPASSLSAADGVDAVVDDNVEVVIAMHDVGHRPMLTEPQR